MKNIFFIHPITKKTNPRGIRLTNINTNLRQIAPENNYTILCFSNNVISQADQPFQVNKFNLIFLLFKYIGFFKLGGKLNKLSRILDPFIFIHFLIKMDIKLRLRKKNKIKEVVFVVMISPFSNYLLVPWLKKKYPDSKIICDIGDPLYKNSARWNDDEISRGIEFKALKLSTNLIVTNELTKAHFTSEFNINSSLIHIIPQGVNTELIESLSQKCMTERKSMAYAGRFYNKLRSPDYLFTALSNQNEYKLDIYGNNEVKKIKNVSFYNSLEQTELFKLLYQYEVLVFIDNKSGVQTSGKIFELLAFKKIILFIKGDEETATYQMASKFRNVIFCENNLNAILEAISKIESLNNFHFNYDCQNFSWRTRAENYLKLFYNGIN
ncbi:hypothetical protein K8089_12150 [Aequorivita sp. F47161]|uniref:Uncharacterized protein n=1 Tax=Aequorivita vitellina TaxID=2874475 RepID=A0A9X1QXN7_9FLAO|nr:hypothetical protein [Aequorivita vitellina]MCG2419776.1 hypothetical protein [Aequorivita vitellina]